MPLQVAIDVLDRGAVHQMRVPRSGNPVSDPRDDDSITAIGVCEDCASGLSDIGATPRTSRGPADMRFGWAMSCWYCRESLDGQTYWMIDCRTVPQSIPLSRTPDRRKVQGEGR